MPTPQEIDEQLVWTIVSTVDACFWRDNGGSAGLIHSMAGRILVVASWRHHRQIEDLLNQLRSPMKPGAATADRAHLMDDNPDRS